MMQKTLFSITQNIEANMAIKEKQEKQQPPFLTYIMIFVFGFIAGVGFSALKLNPGNSSSPSAPQQSSVAQNQTSSAITNLEAEVTANPRNYQAWVQLGHLYFDSNQHDKAITSYNESLKYHDGDANLLTDLGVMYRRTKQPHKAIEFFDKAQAMDPRHEPSRFNEGIVRYYDLQDVAGAIASWEEMLTINPEARSSNGQRIRDFVDQIKREANIK